MTTHTYRIRLVLEVLVIVVTFIIVDR